MVKESKLDIDVPFHSKDRLTLNYQSGLDVATDDLIDTFIDEMRWILVPPTNENLETLYKRNREKILMKLDRAYQKMLTENRQEYFPISKQHKILSESYQYYKYNGLRWRVDFSDNNNIDYGYTYNEYFYTEKEALRYIEQYLKPNNKVHSEPINLEELLKNARSF